MSAIVHTIQAAPEHAAQETELAQLSARIDAATHRQLTLIRELDEAEVWATQGFRSCAAWLGWRRIGLSAVAERVRVARALAQLPVIDASLAQGRVSFSKARALTRVATPANEADLLNIALASTAAQLERICRGLRRASNADASSDDAPLKQPERSVRVRDMGDGTHQLQARLHADEAALVMELLHRVREGLAQEAGRETQPNLADALIRLAYSASAANDDAPTDDLTFAPPREVAVHLETDVLGDLGATLDDGSPVPAETFRRIACDCALRCTVDSPSDDGPLDVGRRTRVISPALRRALKRRDQGCRFPGCTCTRYVDAHHIKHWAHRGETKLDNLVTLCIHHQLLHEGGWSVVSEADSFLFADADGNIRPHVASRAPGKGDLAEVVGPLPTDADPILGIGWDGRPVDYDHVVHVLKAN